MLDMTEPVMERPQWKEAPARSVWKVLAVHLAIAVGLCGLAFVFGDAARGPWSTLTVMCIAFVNEVAGATAAVITGFHPLVGAIVCTLTHLSVLPLMLFGFEYIVNRWKWFRRKRAKIQRISARYEKRGVWMLMPLSVRFGVEICVGVGMVLRFRPSRMVASICLGVFLAALLVTLCGDCIRYLLMM